MAKILTYTGKTIDLDSEFNQSNISIIDIAHHLSLICRFNGATKKFYSVAEHSVFVSLLVPHKYALAGLLHDAEEAYIGDIVRPVRPYLSLPPSIFRLQDNIWETFGCLPDSVGRNIINHVDARMLETEKLNLLDPNAIEPSELKPFRGLKFQELTPAKAEYIFLHRFAHLLGGNNDPTN